MNTYKIDSITIDSVDLKCMVVSRGVKVDNAVYRHHKNISRLDVNPLCCNCLLLSDGTVAQLTDTRFHMRYLSGILSWDNLKLLRYMDDLQTPFSLRMQNGQTVLFYKNEELDTVTFPPPSKFYRQKTASGRTFINNAVLQGLDWVAFQCLWPCEYAASGQPCQFCFSGGDFENAAKKGKALPEAVPAEDLADIVSYAAKNDGISHVQITGGSTFDGRAEYKHIMGYLDAIKKIQPALPGWPDASRPARPCNRGEILLYITPPSDTGTIDEYFGSGAGRIACSLEVWDMARAREITPGKINITGREKHLRILQYTAQKYGPGKAFSNFIIGVEDFETLAEGAEWLAGRGILPSASVWMPMGRPVQGSMKAPGIDYYKRVKELFAELYVKYGLEPTASRGLNVCIERDIWNYA
jgi:hypothetical protein